jgi:hypothetical protein
MFNYTQGKIYLSAIIISVFIVLPGVQLNAQAFTDETVSAGVNIVHDGEDDGTIFPIGTGAAWLDYNNDGNLDIYVTMRMGANYLFHNNGDGTFTDVAEEMGVADASNDGAGVAVADYNNDGFMDIFLANADDDKLFRNIGGDNYLDVTIDAGFNWNDDSRGTSASWGDYNDDGHLDLYVVNYDPVLSSTNSSSVDKLYLNNGNETFTDVSDLLIDAGDISGAGFIATWTDYDRDGDLDIFLVNDCLPPYLVPTRLFRNDGDTHPTLSWNFTEVSDDTGVNDCSNGMGVSVGDYNRDGWMDVFYTDIAEVNLFKNNNGVFEQSTNTAGLGGQAPDVYSWGNNWFDYDLDGWLDLFVTLGVYRYTSNTLPHENMLFHSNGNGVNFTDVSTAMDMDDHGRGRTSIMGDYDNDGDPDIFSVNYGELVALKRNNNNNNNHYLKIHLVGTISNLDGIGSFLKLSSPDGSTQYRETRSGSSLGGGDAIDPYFGVGSNTSGMTLEVTWPSGIVQEIDNISADQYMTVVEPYDPCVAITTPPPTTEGAEICFGETIPALTATVEAGMTVNWYDNVTSGNLLLENSPTFTPTAAGTYYAFAFDPSIGCSSDGVPATLIINDNPSVELGADQETCLGGTLDFSAEASGGTGNINYTWTDDLSDDTELSVTPDITTTYSVTVTDVNGCSSEDVVTAIINTPPEAFAGSDIDLCFGNCFELTPSSTGEAPPFEYEWNVGSQTLVCPTETTTYSVTVTDAKGCIDEDEMTITVHLTPEVTAGDDIDICPGECTTFSPNGFGGLEPYSYSWSSESDIVCPSDTTSYTVTVTDANNCSNTDEITVNVLPPLEINAGEDQSLCEGECFPFNPSVANGQEPYTYIWSNDQLIACPTELTTYYVTVTDANGCSGVDSITLTVIQPASVDVNTEICDGDCITFLASDLNLSSFVMGNQMIQSVTFCEGTTLDLDAIDENGCDATVNFTITIIPLPSVDAGADQTLTCSEETVQIGVNEQQGNIIYQWSNGVNGAFQDVSEGGTYILTVTDTFQGCSASDTVLVSIDTIAPLAVAGEDMELTCATPSVSLDGSMSSQGDNFIAQWTTDDGNILSGADTFMPEVDSPGTYNLTITNETNGCSSSDQVVVTVADEPVVSTEQVTHNHCAGDSNGSISILVNGGLPDYEYLWSNDATTSSIDNLESGTYTISVSDQNGCEVSLSVEITEPFEILLELTATAETGSGTNDGTVSADVSGGTPDYQYEWSTGSTENMISGLTPDMYFLTATDANGCTAVDSVRVNNFDCENITVTATGVFSICPDSNNGSIEITDIVGGEAPFDILWSTNSSEVVIDNLPGGHYSTTITDANNCEIILHFDIEESDTIPPTLLDHTFTLYLDENGMASLTDEMLIAASTDNCSEVSFEMENTSFGCGDIGVTFPGIILSDANGQSDTSTLTITVFDTIPPAIISCPEDIVSGNCTEVNYDLPEASDNCGVTLTMIQGQSSGSTFEEGTTLVEFEATDSGNNSTNCSFTITVENTLEAEVELSGFTCDQEYPFTANLVPSGGTAGYEYIWNNNTTDSTNLLQNPGPWSWTVTDSQGCTVSGEFNLITPDTIGIVLEGISEVEMENNGSVTSTTSGGVTPYTYEWTNEAGDIIATTPDLSGIPAGTYCLQVTDANGCTEMSCVVIDRITGAKNLELEKGIIISPNPASTILNVTFDFDQIELINISLFDVNGKNILVTKKESGENTVKLDVSGFANGVYMLKIQTEGHALLKKVIVHN